MCCPWLFPKTFHYSPLKKPYENSPDCYKTCVSRARPSMKKIQAQITISEDPTKFISETLNSAQLPSPTHALVSTPPYSGSVCRRPSALHYGFHMASHCAVSVSGLTPLLQTQVSTMNVNTTGALLTHHHYQCWRFRSCSAAGEEKKEKRNIRESILPLFLWWLILWANLTRLWCSIIFSNTNLDGTMKVLFRLTFKSVDLV